MKKTIRMTLSVLLAVLLIFGALPFAASAADNSGTCGISGSAVYWEYSNGTLTITSSETGGGTMKDYTASSDPPWIHLSNDITKITVKGVKKIGNYAFYGLSNLTTVEFPDDTDKLRGGFCASPIFFIVGRELALPGIVPAVVNDRLAVQRCCTVES